jgi:hypothetical protein
MKLKKPNATTPSTTNRFFGYDVNESKIFRVGRENFRFITLLTPWGIHARLTSGNRKFFGWVGKIFDSMTYAIRPSFRVRRFISWHFVCTRDAAAGAQEGAVTRQEDTCVRGRMRRASRGQRNKRGDHAHSSSSEKETQNRALVKICKFITIEFSLACAVFVRFFVCAKLGRVGNFFRFDDDSRTNRHARRFWGFFAIERHTHRQCRITCAWGASA